MEKTKTGTRKKPYSILVIATVLTAIITAPIVYVYASSLSSGWTIPPETQESYSYLIFKADLTIYARNGKTGAIDYSGTNASEIISNALSGLTSGRTWKEKVIIKGNFEIDSTILIPSYTLIDLSNAYLTLKDRANVHMLRNTDSAGNIDIEIIGGTIDMNAFSQSGEISAIYLLNSKYIRIRDINIENVQYAGVWLDQTDYATVSGLNILKSEVGGGFAGILIDGNHNIVSNSHIVSRDTKRFGSGMCVHIRNSTHGNQIADNYLEGPEIAISASEYTNYDMIVTGNICNYTYASPRGDGSWNGGGGIWVTSVGGVITDNVVINGGDTGILIATDSYNNVVSGNIVGNFYYEGINVGPSVTQTSNTLVEGNIIWGTNRSGICLANVRGVTVRNNKIFDNSSGCDMQYGIWECGTADDNYIMGNDVRNASRGIVIVGANTVVPEIFAPVTYASAGLSRYNSHAGATIDAYGELCNIELVVPAEFQSLVSIELVYIARETAKGQHVNLYADYGKVGESNSHRTELNSNKDLGPVTNAQIHAENISDLVDAGPLEARDFLGVMVEYSSVAVDTNIHVLGVRLRYQ